MPNTIYDTPQMLMSKMERQQHKENIFLRAMQFGVPKAGNEEIVVIDISYWQDHTKIDYDLLSKNINGVILRGVYAVWKDTRFDIHYDNFSQRGVPIGSYCYLVGNQSGIDQATAFKKAVGSRELKLGIWADVEDRRPGTALSRPIAETFISHCDNLFKTRTDIYTGPYAWQAIMRTGGYSERRLWIANYQVNNPRLPIGGDWSTWWLWQETDRGRHPGYASGLDTNRYNGTTAQWYIDIKSKPVTPEPDPPPVGDLLKVPLFSQKDSRWASDKLGTSNVTIGAYGCLITAAAMVCKFYGYDTDPGKINKDLIRISGYESGNLLRHGDITKIFPNVIVDWPSFITNPSNAVIDAALQRKLPVIAQVDFIPATPVLDQHWVVIIGKDAHGYVIADPIDGKIAPLSKFANKIYRMVIYKQKSIPTPEVLTPEEKLKRLWEAHPELH